MFFLKLDLQDLNLRWSILAGNQANKRASKAHCKWRKRRSDNLCKGSKQTQLLKNIGVWQFAIYL